MEDILFGASVAAFALAAASLITAGVIFIKLDVPAALRFLRHKAVPTLPSKPAASDPCLESPALQTKPVDSQTTASAPPAEQPVPEPPTHFLPFDEPGKEHPCLN